MATKKTGKRQIKYSEPSDFFPKSINDKYFGKKATAKKSTTKKK